MPNRLQIWVAAALLLGSGSLAWGQNYRFQVETMELQVYVRPDASARLHYKIVFQNDPTAQAIDIVDVGLPHRDYNISNMSASIDGQPLNTIRRSEYIDVGVEVPLSPWVIPPGQKGTFEFECTMPDMVYQDTTDSERASLQIRPTWFDPNLQTGQTDLKIAVHLLPAVKEGEVTYHQEATRYHNLVLFGQGDDKHVAAVWQWPNHALSSANPKVGLSFPQTGMQRVVKITAFGLFLKWFEGSTEAQVISGLLLMATLAFLFFRFSGGTGCAVFAMLALGLWCMIAADARIHLFSWPVVLGLVGLSEWYRANRKERYLPAMATIEGGGIKRGLTAPQAAVLLELPLGQVLTLVIFGLLKKGILEQVQADPLVVRVKEEYRGSRKSRRKNAARNGTVVHDYEQGFITVLIDWDQPVAEKRYSGPIKDLVKSVVSRMKGFDLSDTQAYYRRIVSRAWKEAEGIGEIEQREKVVDRSLEWLMLDPAWNERFDTWHHRGYHYRPSWTRSHVGDAAASVPQPSASTSQTTFGEVASSFVGWTENTTGRLAQAIEPGSLSVPNPSGTGIIDLSGVDKVTADVFEALGEAAASGGGGGGGGGGCACACAGCACACACAGGGR